MLLVACCLTRDTGFFFAGIIAKDPTSLEEEIKEIRRSGSSKALDKTPEFELSDIFYFCRKGMETIMDDEVTKRFSAEELESWNLLSRTNYNFQYISLRLTILWGLGVLIRYCFLLPLRWGCALKASVSCMAYPSHFDLFSIYKGG